MDYVFYVDSVVAHQMWLFMSRNTDEFIRRDNRKSLQVGIKMHE